MEDGLEGYWNSWGLREVRRKMLTGRKVSECEWCYYDESIGKISKRQGSNIDWLKKNRYGRYTRDILDRVEKSKTNGYRVEKSPLRLDIRSKNTCNLKCRMCVPRSSSKIEQEQREMLKGGGTSFIDIDYLKMDKKFFNWHKNSKQIWNTVYKWSPGIKSLYFTGGEPTLIKEIWDFIDYLKEKDLAKNINLDFNTNCTQNPDRLIETFDIFRSIEIMFSIDGFKEVNDYIRFPSKWTEIESNIIKMMNSKKDNTYLYFAFAIQVYNILDLPQLLQWISRLPDEYGDDILRPIMLFRPDFLNIDILPKNVKKTALLKLEQISFSNKNGKWNFSKSSNRRKGYFLHAINSIKNSLKNEEKPGIEKHLKNFYKYTKLLDRHRGNSFEQTFPELNALLNEDGRWRV